MNTELNDNEHMNVTDAAKNQAALKGVKPQRRLFLRTKALTKAFGGQQVLNGIDLDLHEGQVVLLQGPNGSGKTTLLNILTGNLEQDSGCIELFTNDNKEVFRFPRRWWQNLNPWDHFLPERVASEGVGRSWQEIRLFHSVKLIDNIVVADNQQPGENPFNLFIKPRLVRYVESKLQKTGNQRLTLLGLEERGSSSGDKVSLGQSKRVAIARSVQAGAKILFLDEPLAGLDADGITKTMELLRELATHQKITLVIIEHVLNVQSVYPILDTVWNLKGGRLLVEAKHNNGHSNIDFQALQWNNLFSDFQLDRQQDLGQGASLDVYRQTHGTDSKSLLNVDNLRVFRGRRQVIGSENIHKDSSVSGLSFELRNGDLAILRAPNGWGKTTLLDALSGVLPTTNGTITLSLQDITKSTSWKRVRDGIQYLRSEARMFPSLSLTDVSHLFGVDVIIEDKNSSTTRFYGDLSGGQKQKLRLKCVAASQAKLFLFDEPFSALDSSSLTGVIDLIRKNTLLNRCAILIALPDIQSPLPTERRSVKQ